MASRAPRFKQVDLTRAAKALAKAGERWGKIEIDPNGKITILPPAADNAAPGSSWDDV